MADQKKSKEEKEKEETQREFDRLFRSRDQRALLFNWERKNGVKKTPIGADRGADQSSYGSSKRRKLKRPRSETENEGSSFKTVISICSTSNTSPVIDSLIEKTKHVGEESDLESGPSSLPPFDTGEVYTDGRSGEQPEVVRREMKIPKDKVNLVFDKGSERITKMQSSSGAHIQVPLNLPPGDTSTETTLEQIESAKQLVNEAINSKARSKTESARNEEELSAEAIKKKEAEEIEKKEAEERDRMLQKLDTDGRSGEQPEVVRTELKIPKDKVDLAFDKGSETITKMQASSGARIQVSETTVYMEGTLEQIESAKQLVNEAIISKARSKTESARNKEELSAEAIKKKEAEERDKMLQMLDTDGRSGRQPEAVRTEMKNPKDKVVDEPALQKKLPLVSLPPGPSELNQDNTSTGNVGKGDGFSKYLLELDKAGIEVFEKLPVEVQCQLRESYEQVLVMKKFLIQRNQKLLAQYLPPVEATQGDDLNSYLLEVYKADVNRADINGFKELPDEVQVQMRESHGHVQSFKNLLINADRLTLALHLPPVALPPVVYRGDEEFIPLE